MNTRPPRLFYVDNLRIVLSSLVVLFHLSITYGAVGGWAYIETKAEFPDSYFLTLFTATCQSFFMGMFFLISAYFTHGAFERKGTRRFLQDRLLRLGIPLAIYFFFLEPLTGYFARSWMPNHMSFLEVLLSGRGRGIGAMWFLVALGCFTLLYVAARFAFVRRRRDIHGRPFVLRDVHLLVFIFCLSLVTFLVRLAFPISRTIQVLNFTVAHFPQYIALFALGIVAAHRQVQSPVSVQQAKRWGFCAVVMVAFVFPALFFLGGAITGNVRVFMGGPHWQSLAFSFWEQCTGIAIMVALLGFAREKWNKAGKIKQALAASVYTVYVFHPPIVVGISVLLRNWALPPLAKFIVLSPIVLAACFLFAYLIRRAPCVKRIL